MINWDETQPRYVISVAARILGVQVHTLRYYEKADIIKPSRSQGNTRLYSQRDIALLSHMKSLIDDLGVNLAGAEVIIRMSQQTRELQKRIEELESEIERVREVRGQ